MYDQGTNHVQTIYANFLWAQTCMDQFVCIQMMYLTKLVRASITFKGFFSCINLMVVNAFIYLFVQEHQPRTGLNPTSPVSVVKNRILFFKQNPNLKVPDGRKYYGNIRILNNFSNVFCYS